MSSVLSAGGESERPLTKPSDASLRTSFLSRVGRPFASVDLRSLALLRIALGLVLSVDLVARMRLVDTLYSNDGVLTNHFSLFRPLAPFQFSLYVSASSTRDVMVVFWLTLLVYLLFTVGYRTRLFQIFSFICVTSLHSRNLLAELPSDVPLHLLMAWSLVMPLGARFSIDNVRKSLRRANESSPDELNLKMPPVIAFVSIAVFGMILQLSIMHLVPALRQDGPAWRDGTALYYVLHHNMWATDFGAWVVAHASLDGIRTLSSGFRATEIAIAALVLVPVWYVRRVALLLLVLFHLACRALWNLGPYEWVMIAGSSILVTSRDWDAFGRWYLRRKPALTVYFDADCGICFALCRFLRRLDALARLTFAANSSDAAPDDVKAAAAETVVVRDENSKKTFTKSRALAAIVACLPLGKPFSLVLRAPGISRLADLAYDQVAKNRTAISVWFGYEACGTHTDSAPPAQSPSDEPIPELARGLMVTRETAAALFLAACGVALFVRMNDETKPHGFEVPIYSLVAYPRIFQDFKLFAPDPPKRMGMLVVDAQTAKGAKLDPMTGSPPLTALDPNVPDPRARPAPLLGAYFSSINRPDRVIYVDELRNYIQRIGDLREAGDKLSWFNVNWIEAPIPSPNGSSAPPSETAEVIPPRRITSRP